MSIHFGDDIKRLYHDGDWIKRVYLGDELVWREGYPISSTWSGTVVSDGTVVFEHAITEAGAYAFDFGGVIPSYITLRVEVPGHTKTRSYSLDDSTDWVRLARSLNVGDVVRFVASTTVGTTKAATLQFSIRQSTHPIAGLNPDLWLPFEGQLFANYGIGGAGGTPQSPMPSLEDGFGRFNGGQSTVPIVDTWSTGGTIGLWFRHRSTTSGGKIFLHRYGASNNTSYELYLNTDPATGRPYAGTSINGAWWDISYPLGAVNIADGNWHFIVANINKYSSSRWALTLWVDNLEPRQVTRALSTFGNFSNHPLYIGGGANGTRYNFDADDVFSVPFEMSTSMIHGLYAAGRTGS